MGDDHEKDQEDQPSSTEDEDKESSSGPGLHAPYPDFDEFRWQMSQ